METVKRVYAKPAILKVQLSHEQAVLGTCSMSTGGLSRRGSASLICNPTSGGRACRKDSSPFGQDFKATS